MFSIFLHCYNCKFLSLFVRWSLFISDFHQLGYNTIKFFLVLEAVEENANKTKSFFIYTVDNWDAELYAKVEDNVYINLGMWSLIYIVMNA